MSLSQSRAATSKGTPLLVSFRWENIVTTLRLGGSRGGDRYHPQLTLPRVTGRRGSGRAPVLLEKWVLCESVWLTVVSYCQSYRAEQWSPYWHPILSTRVLGTPTLVRSERDVGDRTRRERGKDGRKEWRYVLGGIYGTRRVIRNTSIRDEVRDGDPLD